MDQEAFQKHLSEEHNEHTIANHLKEFIYGGSDGIVTTFAVVAGFSGANIGQGNLNLAMVSVLLFGLANLFADGAAMGLGSLLSLRSHKKLYENAYQKEFEETKNSFDFEVLETEHILEEQGFSKSNAKELTKIISTNREFWAKFMVKYELGITNPDNENEYLNGLATFASFLIFGFIPLTPYFFKGNQDDLFLYSIIATFFSLCLLGFLRAYLAKERLIPAVGEVLFVGVVSSSLAYLVGFLFKNIV
tara:strand:+ start:381 stop:1124 length:744 start_codon:yes stop_codon:yes gene_type:complete